MSRHARTLRNLGPLKWTLAVLIALVTHGMWFVLLSHSGLEREPRIRVSVPLHVVTEAALEEGVAYFSGTGLWSPVSFALPTTLGFSRSLLLSDAKLMPPMGVSSDFSMLMERPADEVDRGPGLRVPTLPELVARTDRSGDVSGYMRSSPVADKPHIHPRVRVLWLSGRHGDSFTQYPLPDDTSWGEAPWEAEVVLEIDPPGIVTRAFFERRTGRIELDDRLIRLVRTWRAEPSHEPSSSRIAMIYYGSAAAPDPQEVAP